VIVDAHIHCSGRENSADTLRALDAAGVDAAVLLAPFLSEGYALDDPASLARGNDHLARLVAGHRDRLIGFAVVNPSHPGALTEARRAIETLGLAGLKMVPSGWYPYDDVVQPVFAYAAEQRLPVLFHSGIFIDGRSGRFCRPVFFEALRAHPGMRATLAHLGWPWTDEAIAVGLIDRIHGVDPAEALFRFDISFGAPPPYRLGVMHRALQVLGADTLQFGSDCFLPVSGAELRERRACVEELLDMLEVGDAERAALFGGTARAWLGRLPAPLRQAA
jgi:predicted TIM-barrel fold metal-dependent hydrolase